jgi:redox-sensitive bicupin YhaK (pirin superfamily)
MEIISYVLSGSLQHKDSMGNGRIIRPGEFQYMAAGSGILHSEFNPSAEEAVHFLQIWIEPDRKGLAPHYAEKNVAGSETGRFQLIASKTGRQESFAINQDADLWHARLEPCQRLEHHRGPGRHAWLHVAEGQVSLNGTLLDAGDAAGLNGEEGLVLSASKNSQILFFDLK